LLQLEALLVVARRAGMARLWAQHGQQVAASRFCADAYFPVEMKQ
jgi:hypothetical protein